MQSLTFFLIIKLLFTVDGWIEFYPDIYSRRQYKVSIPFKKTRCPTAYQRF